MSFGSTVPYAEPIWYQGGTSPYYTDAHRVFRARVRSFVDAELLPHCGNWDELGAFPAQLRTKAYAAGLLMPWVRRCDGGTPPRVDGRAHDYVSSNDTAGSFQFDVWHDLIWADELARCGAGGVVLAVFLIPTMALPPVLTFGNSVTRAAVRRCITGEESIALCISEPGVGSDVARMTTTATLSACGTYYTVTGSKKFITNGCEADWYTTAVRTGADNSGGAGVSLLLIQRHAPGVRVRKLPTQGWWCSGTALILFDAVKVPATHLIGSENEGFKIIMRNFNHERFILTVIAVRFARVCVEEAIVFARRRRTFGRRLIEHQVIRHKLADCVRQVEVSQAYLDVCAYQLHTNVGGADGMSAVRLGGLLALAKVQATQCMALCAREASQVFGGASYVRGGVGERVERLYRERGANAIGGGTEEILSGMAMKAAKL